MATSNGLLFWLLRKLVLALLLAALGLGGVGFWLFQRDGTDFAGRRRDLRHNLAQEAAGLRTSIKEVDARLAEGRIGVAAQKERAAQAGRVAKELDDMSSGLNRLTTASAQLRENEERLQRMQQMETDSLKKVVELEQGLVRSQWEKDGMQIALARTQEHLDTVEASESAVMHYAREAWDSSGQWVLVVVGVIMILPAFWRRR